MRLNWKFWRSTNLSTKDNTALQLRFRSCDVIGCLKCRRSKFWSYGQTIVRQCKQIQIKWLRLLVTFHYLLFMLNRWWPKNSLDFSGSNCWLENPDLNWRTCCSDRGRTWCCWGWIWKAVARKWRVVFFVLFWCIYFLRMLCYTLHY